MALEDVTTSAEIATQFEIFVPEDLTPEDPDGILSEEEVSATAEAPVSSPTFKIHPSSTFSSSPAKSEPHYDTFLPHIDSGTAFANLTPADMLKTLQTLSVKPSPVKHEKIKMTCASMEEARTWMEKEEEEKLFSFSSQGRIAPRGANVEWMMKYVYGCSRAASGGKKAYTKKHNWARKIPSKHTSCKVLLRLTHYADRVEGSYVPTHNHPLGRENARFTSISASTRREIEAMLRNGMPSSKVVRKWQLLYVKRLLTCRSALSWTRSIRTFMTNVTSRTFVHGGVEGMIL